MKNIILIGMPGCGKSTLGIVVAKMLCMDFVDVDLIIQKEIGMSLQEYINRYGVSAFLEKEADVIETLDFENSIVSTGGSAVLTKRGAEHLKKMGDNVYIKIPYKEIVQRINNLSSRGVAMEKGETLEDVYRFRSPIYEKYADLTVDISGADIAYNCTKLAKEIEKLK